MPAVGERIEFAGIEFEVADAYAHRVNRVRLRAVDETAASAETEVQGREPVEG